MRRRELFPTDRGLQVRMLAAAVLTPALVFAALVAIALTAETKVHIGLALVAAIGLTSAIGALRQADKLLGVPPGEGSELQAVVDRLCVLVDIPKPEVVVVGHLQPNSWVIDLPGRPPRLHVTRGLLDMLSPEELEAVLAHELSHVAHRDATVMTVVGLPGAAMREGSRDAGGLWWMFFIAFAIARVIGSVSQAGTNALSRYRETAADAAAARITGRPAALASALMKVSGRLDAIPLHDLRTAGPHNAFNLLPVEKDEHHGWRARVFRPLTATHPSLDQRVAALEELERRMHGARPSSRLLD